jgi:hypothetical protein
MSMALIPTVDQLKALQLVEQSGTGIGAVLNRDDGLECVNEGWLEHREHRREEGGVIDVWDLTAQGRMVLMSHDRQLNGDQILDEKAA